MNGKETSCSNELLLIKMHCLLVERNHATFSKLYVSVAIKNEFQKTVWREIYVYVLEDINTVS